MNIRESLIFWTVQEAQQFEKTLAHALLDIRWLGCVQSRADGEKWAWTGRQDAMVNELNGMLGVMVDMGPDLNKKPGVHGT